MAASVQISASTASPDSCTMVLSLEPLRIFGGLWSYQPSESSYAMMTAVESHSSEFCSSLM